MKFSLPARPLHHVGRYIFLLVSLTALASCARGAADSANVPSRQPAATSVAASSGDSAQAARDAQDDGQWLMAAHDYASTRYSGLNQITTENVKSLRLAWSFSTGVLRGHEGAPLVIGSTMYLVWNVSNSDSDRPGEFSAFRDLRTGFGAAGTQVLMLKFNYWLGL